MAKKAIVVAIATAVCLSGASSVQARDNHAWTYCGDQPELGAGWYNVRAFNVKCGRARKVTKHYWESRDNRFNGWHCDSDRQGIELYRADCKRNRNQGHQHIRFSYGS